MTGRKGRNGRWKGRNIPVMMDTKAVTAAVPASLATGKQLLPRLHKRCCVM